MKTLTIALAAALGLAFVAPVTNAQAETKTVIIKRGHDRGHHFGWRHHHDGKKVVIIKKHHHHEM